MEFKEKKEIIIKLSVDETYCITKIIETMDIVSQFLYDRDLFIETECERFNITFEDLDNIKANLSLLIENNGILKVKRG